MNERLVVATFNLENLDDDGGEPALEERIAILRPQLVRLDADILCLQEVNGQRETKGRPRALRALRRLLDGTPYAGWTVATGVEGGVEADADAGDGGGTGLGDKHNLVIVSRLPVVASRRLRHDLVPPPLVRLATALPASTEPEPVEWDRPILHAEIDLGGGRRLHVFNLHLRAPLAAPIPGRKIGALRWASVSGWGEGFFLAAIKRAGQALEVRMAVDLVFDQDPGALIIVAGDYNAEQRQTPVRLIQGDVDDTGNGHLAYRALVPVERGLPAERRFSVLHGGQPAMLDHLLVSRAMMAWFRRVDIHNEALGDELVAHATIAHSPESYHAPVVATFEIPVPA